MSGAGVIASFYDALAPGYDDLCREDAHEIEEIRALLAEPRGRILDVGVGTGRIAIELARIGWHVDGVDISEGMLLRARSNAEHAGVGDRMRFFLGDVAEPGALPPGPYEAVLSIGCLFHLPRGVHRQFLAGLAQRLGPDGVVLVDIETGPAGGWPSYDARTLSTRDSDELLRLEINSVRNEAGRQQRGRFTFAWPSGKTETHELTASWMSVAELRSMIESAGLRIHWIKEGWGRREGSARPANALALAQLP